LPAKPVAKIQAVGVGGAAGIILVAIAGAAGLDIAPEVSAAIVTLLSFGAGYLKRGS
jgi:hypothetical protein